ncbi:hypothetical protein [Collimonas silvisoli]|uniref:hypothetical protein n=1 Tax=Collimonas silvisoli TaxID=2825884 RepID=UPI001B8BD556|nr:hypothetical protein [Collimonas silvisoli]
MTWRERAQDLHRRIAKSHAPDNIKFAAWDAQQCFVKAQEMRRQYHRAAVKEEGTLREAARLHRQGAALFSIVTAWTRQ